MQKLMLMHLIGQSAMYIPLRNTTWNFTNGTWFFVTIIDRSRNNLKPEQIDTRITASSPADAEATVLSLYLNRCSDVQRNYLISQRIVTATACIDDRSPLPVRI